MNTTDDTLFNQLIDVYNGHSKDFKDDSEIIKAISLLSYKTRDGKTIIGFNYIDAVEFLHDYFNKFEVDWLLDIGLLNAPASVKYHGNYVGGLFVHSLLVGVELINYTNRMNLEWKNDKSPMRIALLHDICKTDDYIYNDNTDIFNVSKNENKKYTGHADKSIIMLAGNINVSEEEKLCIRHHMGPYTDKSEWGALSNAIISNVNVFYTHCADLIASKLREV